MSGQLIGHKHDVEAGLGGVLLEVVVRAERQRDLFVNVRIDPAAESNEQVGIGLCARAPGRVHRGNKLAFSDFR